MKINMDTDSKTMEIYVTSVDFDDVTLAAHYVVVMDAIGVNMGIREFRLSLPAGHPYSVYTLDYLHRCDKDDEIHPVLESTDLDTQRDTWVWRYDE